MPQLSQEEVFLARLGHMLLAWNQAEYQAKLHINWLCANDHILALTAGLTSVETRDALKAIASRLQNEKLAAHLTHFAEYFDILREYRNYYAHGLTRVFAPDPNSPAIGSVSQITARQRLAFDSDFVRSEHFEFVITHALTLSAYGRAIQLEYAHGENSAAVLKEFSSWPENPPLPQSLQKNRTVIGRLDPPP